MTEVLQPGVTVAITSESSTVANEPQKVLFVGQQTSAGSAVSGALQSNIQNDNSWDTLYGEDSMLAEMLRRARAINTVSQFDAIGLADNGGGSPAGIDIAVTGTATEDGILTISIGSFNNHTVTAAVTDTDTATLIGDAIEAAINADATMPFTASNSAGTVTLSAVNAGTYGNTFGVQVTGADIAGISIAIAAGTGSTDPVLTGVFDVVGTTRYQTIIWPYADDTSVLRTFLDARFNADDRVLDGVGITGAVGTATALDATYSALNSQSLTVVGDATETQTIVNGVVKSKVPSIFEIPVVVAATLGAVRALRLTEGANIASFLSGTTGNDAFGGPALASRPYFNTPFTTLPLADPGTGFTPEEVEDLLDAGVTVMGNNSAANLIILGETVTTYKNDSAGNTDVTFKFLNYVDTSSNVREYFANNLRSRFTQTRLTEGDLVIGRPSANEALISATLNEFYTTLSGVNFALTQAGETARQTFINNTTITIDTSIGLVTILMAAVPIVTQVRQFNATITIVFSSTG